MKPSHIGAGTSGVQFASAFANPAGSPIRELFPYLTLPRMISFAGGYPSAELFDAEGLREASGRALSDTTASLQYGPTEGVSRLREALTQLCEARGIQAAASEVLVTTGSQQAFDLLVKVFLDPGDLVYVESPAYPATLQTLKLAGARIQPLPTDADGLDTDALEDRLSTAALIDRPKLLYSVPTFSNPSGTLLPQERREHLIRLAIKHKFLIIEDDPYGALTFEDEVPLPIYATGQRLSADDNPVIYLSSLSKTVAPSVANRMDDWRVRDATALCCGQADGRPVHFLDDTANSGGVPRIRSLLADVVCRSVRIQASDAGNGRWDR